MRRLTKKCGGRWQLEEPFPVMDGKCPLQACVDSLGEYEDTGLTPDKIREMDKLFAEKCREVAELERKIAGLEASAGEGERRNGKETT